jgi:hypothetical protein
MKKIMAVVVALAALTAAAGCSKKMDATDREGSAAQEINAKVVPAAFGENRFDEEAAASAASGSRKLIVTAALRVRFSDLKKGETELNGILAAYNAYSASTSAQENRRRYTIRVPSGSYAACLADLKNMGNLLSYSEETEDAAARYYDLESRLTTQRELLKTFQAYLGKAASIDDIMTVERRIAELQREIDDTGSQFRSLSYRIDYAAIELDLWGPESARAYGKPSIGERVAGLFRVFTDYASVVALVLLGIVIYGTPSVLVLALLYWLLLGKIGLLRTLRRLVGEKSVKR